MVSATQFGSLIGQTPVMKKLFEMIERAAKYDVSVCIEGESGTGKELVATEIHRLSSRNHQPFVTLNCGAIPETLVSIGGNKAKAARLLGISRKTLYSWLEES